ncbi:MAG: RpiB/LacA/LacB family sugar-phosphate isomerase, partial [Alphaproteobacteria bacterium]
MGQGAANGAAARRGPDDRSGEPPDGKPEGGPQGGPGGVIAVAADHAGWPLKALLAAWLADAGHTILDLGTDGPASVDYPDMADRLAAALADGRAGRGILVCGTGIGIAMAANRHAHIRCAPVGSVTEARLAREHNDANVLALGERLIGEAVAKDCVAAFLSTQASTQERHRRRVAKLS